MRLSGCTVTVEAAFDDVLFAASPSWTDITNYVRDSGGITLRRSGRTSEIADFQPGTAEIVCNARDRALDPTYGPASVSFTNGHWTVGDVAGLSGATTLDFRFAVSLDDWTPTTDMVICSQYGAAGTRAFRLYVATTGLLTLVTSNDGTATADGTSQVQFCAVNGQTVAGRVTWTTAGTANFYIKRSTKDRVKQDAKSHDNWVLVGTDATAGTAALFNSSTGVRVGRLGNNNDPLTGDVYYCSIATTLDDDTPLVVFDPKDATSSSSTSWTGSDDGLSWTSSGTFTVDPQGTYWGRLLPGTPIRVSATYAGDTRRLWYGYLRRAVLRYPGTVDATVTLQAADALSWLGDRQAPSTPFGIELEVAAQKPSAYWPLHEPILARTFSDQYGAAHGAWDAQTIESGDPSQPASQLPTHKLSGRAKAVANGTLEGKTASQWVADPGYFRIGFWVFMPDDGTGSFRVMSDSLGLTYGTELVGDFVYSLSDQTTFTAVLTPGPHFIVAETDDISYWDVYVDGVGPFGTGAGSTAPTTDIVNTLFVQGVNGVTISDVINGGEYDMAELYRAGSDGRHLDTSSVRMTWLLDAAGIPTDLQDVTGDESTFLGPSSAGGTYGELMRQVNAAEAGRLFVGANGKVIFRSKLWALRNTRSVDSQGTFSDTFVDIALQPADVSDVINEAIVTIADGSQGIYRDQESITLYGPKPASFSAPLDSPESAAGLGQYYVGLRGHPHTRISSVTLKPRHATNGAVLFPHVLDRDIGERITVIRDVSSTTSPITAAVTIEGISHRITADEWTTTWTTVPAQLTAEEAGILDLDNPPFDVLDAGLVLVP